MSALIALAFVVVVSVASWWLTGRLRDYAVARHILDIPNVRSSHAVATPRGGGLAIVVTTLAALAVLGGANLLPWDVVAGLVGGGALVAIVGSADDHWHLPPSWRLLGHFAAATWILSCFGSLPAVPLPWRVVEVSGLGYALAALYLVWVLNLTNFMDGIDGIAAVEAITVSACGAVLGLVVSPGSTAWLAPVALASATLGFLVWNWPPARIFMGDAGSGFLGLMLAAFSLQATSTAPVLVWCWMILLGAFVVDATLTLVRRVARGERFYEAHRSHAYQHAALRYGTHLGVTLGIGLINVCWLLPLALLVALGHLDGLTGMCIAYAPLAIGALWLKAGTPSTSTPPAHRSES